MKIYEYLKQLRLQNKMSSQELVTKLEEVATILPVDNEKNLKWSISKISKIEAGNQPLTIDELDLIALVLGKTSKEIIEEAGSKSVTPLASTGIPTCTTNRGSDVQMGLQYVLDEYPNAIKGSFKGTPIREPVTKKLPKAIQNLCGLDTKKFLIKGSIGNGQFADVAWISIFNKDITDSATKGFYIVFLFAADMSGVFLSLNQGFTYFDNRFKGDPTTTGIAQIKNASTYIYNQFHNIPPEFDLRAIDLKCKGKLAKGYAAGHIAGKFYKSNCIPSDEELRHDILKLMSLYEELCNIKKDHSIDEFYDEIVNNVYQSSLTEAYHNKGLVLSDEEILKTLENMTIDDMEDVDVEYFTPSEKIPVIKTEGGKVSYPRDPKISAEALKHAKHKCEYDNTHMTFIRRSTGTNYTEPHHLIPISNHAKFDYSLDVVPNICSLCVTCHSICHYGVDEDRLPILEKLYNERKEMLKQAGLDITLEQLKKYYGIK